MVSDFSKDIERSLTGGNWQKKLWKVYTAKDFPSNRLISLCQNMMGKCICFQQYIIFRVVKIRKHIFFLKLILFILGVTGCQTVDSSGADHVPRMEQETYPVTSEVVEYNHLPERLQLWIETNKLSETELVKAFTIEDKTYIVVLLSEKDALNYGVQITEVYDQI